MPGTDSAYMLFFSELSDECYAGMSAAEKQQLAAAWNAWYDGLAAAGKVQHGHPLEPARRVVSGSRGESVVDGPFAEAKETIGGYFLLTVDSFDEATEIAQRCPSLRLGMKIEVRRVAGSCAQLGVEGRPAAAAHAQA